MTDCPAVGFATFFEIVGATTVVVSVPGVVPVTDSAPGGYEPPEPFIAPDWYAGSRLGPRVGSPPPPLRVVNP